MVTLADVARQAHVSTMTVSRVINGTGSVNEETRACVLQAIEALGYRTNMLARGLATGRSNIIAYIVADISDPYFDRIFKSVERTCKENGILAVFFGAQNRKELYLALQMSMSHKFDGVIMHDLDVDEGILSLLSSQQIPCVLVDNERPAEQVTTLNLNHYAAALAGAEIFAHRSYAAIYCVHGPITPVPEKAAGGSRRQTQRRIWQERTRGFCDGLARYGLTPKLLAADRFETGNDYLTAYGAAEEIFRRAAWPAAVYCEDDILALSVSGYMQEHGVEMPEQLSLLGNDGSEISMTLYPRISCLRHPRDTIGRRAVELLLEQIRTPGPVTHEILEIELFRGDTTKKPE